MLMLSFVILSILISVVVGMITIPRIVLISKKKRLFDKIDERKVHKNPTSRLGGIAFLPTMLIAFCFAIGMRYFFGYDVALGYERPFIVEFMFFLVGIFNLFFVGIADDLIGVSYRQKFAVQVLSAIMLIFGGVYFTDFEGLLGMHQVPPVVGGVCTILFVVFLVNAFNLIDGIDGLCALLSILAISVIGTLFFLDELFVYSILSFSLLGVLIAFYYYNALSTKLKVFMGDSGSLIVGYVISFLFIKYCNENSIPGQEYLLRNIAVVLLGIVFVPCFDALRVFFMRVAHGKSPFRPDKKHIHHKFLRMGYTHKQASLVILAIALGYVVLNFFLQRIGVNINIQLLVNLVVGVVVDLVMNRVLHVKKQSL